MRRFGGLASGVLILAFLAYGVVEGWGHVSDYAWELDPPLLVGGVLILFAFYLSTGLAYVSIIERLGVTGEVSRAAVLQLWAKSLLGRYVPGNVLMVTGRVVLGREAGVPARVTLAATVYEQALLLTTAALASVVFLLAYDSPQSFSWLLLVVAVAAAAALLHPRVFGPLSTWVLTRLKREPLKELLSERELAGLFLYYAAANLLLALGVWMVVRSSAGPEAGSLGYVGLAFLLSFVLGMVAFFFPSGLGVRETAFALFLGKYLPGGVAVAVAAGVRLVVTAVELVFVALVVGVPRLLDRLSSARTPRPTPR